MEIDELMGIVVDTSVVASAVALGKDELIVEGSNVVGATEVAFEPSSVVLAIVVVSFNASSAVELLMVGSDVVKVSLAKSFVVSTGGKAVARGAFTAF